MMTTRFAYGPLSPSSSGVRAGTAGRGRSWRPPVTTEKYDTRLLLTRLRRERRRGNAAVLLVLAAVAVAVAGFIELREASAGSPVPAHSSSALSPGEDRAASAGGSAWGGIGKSSTSAW